MTQDELNAALSEAAFAGAIDIVKIRVRQGANVNTVNWTGVTALHKAASNGHAAVVEYLVDKGAEVNAANLWSDTPLHWAALGGHAAVVEFLVDKGANVNATNKVGNTPLDVAAVFGHAAVVEFLVTKGDDVDAVNQCDDTPLHQAAGSGHASGAELLQQAETVQSKNDDRRDAALALLTEDGTLRRRLGIKADLEVAPEFDVERLLKFAVKKRSAADPTLEADVETGIEFHLQASKMLDNEAEHGNPMRPWRR